MKQLCCHVTYYMCLYIDSSILTIIFMTVVIVYTYYLCIYIYHMSGLSGLRTLSAGNLYHTLWYNDISIL